MWKYCEYNIDIRLFQPLFAVWLRVKGSKINETAVPKSTKPTTFSCWKKARKRPAKDSCSFTGIKPNRFALRSAHTRVTTSGKTVAGTMIANMPSDKGRGSVIIGIRKTQRTSPSPCGVFQNSRRDIGTDERVDDIG